VRNGWRREKRREEEKIGVRKEGETGGVKKEKGGQRVKFSYCCYDSTAEEEKGGDSPDSC